MENEFEKIDYGKIIKALRRSRKMTQTELGEYISMGKTAISNYEKGYSVPSARVLEKLAAVFNMKLVEFLAYEYNDVMASQKSVDNRPGNQFASEMIIPYLKSENVRESVIEAFNFNDSILTLPSFMLKDKKDYICVKVPDNSMEADGIYKNDYIIVKKSKEILNKQLVLALDNKKDTYIIRRYIREGHIASLIPNSAAGDYAVLRVDERDSKFNIVGYVEKIIASVK